MQKYAEMSRTNYPVTDSQNSASSSKVIIITQSLKIKKNILSATNSI